MKVFFLMYARDLRIFYCVSCPYIDKEKPFAAQGRQILTETTRGFA
jgi:hypothetical protein|nr:MAG TPA: Rdx family [Microviridae sp.]